MNRLKIKDLKTYSKDTLEELLKEKLEALRVFNFNAPISKVKNVKEGRELRKEIARILTQLNSLNKKPK